MKTGKRGGSDEEGGRCHFVGGEVKRLVGGEVQRASAELGVRETGGPETRSQIWALATSNGLPEAHLLARVDLAGETRFCKCLHLLDACAHLSEGYLGQ